MSSFAPKSWYNNYFLRTFVILCHIIYNKVYDFRRYTRNLQKCLAVS